MNCTKMRISALGAQSCGAWQGPHSRARVVLGRSRGGGGGTIAEQGCARGCLQHIHAVRKSPGSLVCESKKSRTESGEQDMAVGMPVRDTRIVVNSIFLPGHATESGVVHIPGSCARLEGTVHGSKAGPGRENDANGGTVSTELDETREEAASGQPIRHQWWMKLRDTVTPRTRGIILLNLLTMLYGTNIAVLKEVEISMDPALFAAGRFGIATLAFSPFLHTAWKDDQVRLAGLELGAWASLGYLTQAVGVLTTEAGRASFISTFTVIVVPLLAGCFGARIPKLTWGAAAAALLGVALLESSDSAPTVGDLYTFISAVAGGIQIFRTEHYSKSMKSDTATALIALQLLVIAVVSCIWSGCDFLTSGKDVDIANLSTSWAGCWDCVTSLPLWPMLYTGLLTTAFCLWIEVVAMRDVTATETAVIYTLEPLWGAAVAWILLGERWGPHGWLGSFFILGGSLVMQIFGQPPLQSTK